MIRTIIKKEIREIWRDPYTLGIALVLPVILLFLFAYSLNLDVKNIPLAVFDQDNSRDSRAYVDAVINTGKFDLSYRPATPEDAERLLDKGAAQVVIMIPSGFRQTLLEGGSAEIQTLVDGTFPTSARVVIGHIEAINSVFTYRLLGEHFASLGLSASGLLEPAVMAVPTIRYNPSLKSANLIVPGLIGVLLMAFPPLLSALAIVREKERGSIQQIFISPVRPAAFIIGKLVPYVVIAYIELLMVFAAARYWFEAPLAGNVWLFILASVPYVISTVAIGLLVSTITRTQLTAMLLAVVITFMPSFLFSGFMFPLFTMPLALQIYSYLFPARYFIEITYDIFLKGVGMEVWGWQLGVLSLYTAGLVVLAASRFNKKAG